MRLLTIVNAELLLNYKRKDALGNWLSEVKEGLKKGEYKIRRHKSSLGVSASDVEIWK